MRKLAVLLAVPLVGGLASIALYAWFLSRSAADPASLNLAGNQQVLLAEFHARSDMVLFGHDEDREDLRQRAAEFDRVLRALRDGGNVKGRTLPPAPAEVRDELDTVSGLWEQLQPSVLVVADAPAGDPRVMEAGRIVQQKTPMLYDASDRVVSAYEARISRQHRWMFASLAGLGAFLLLLLAAGYLAARRYLLRPILEVDVAARRFLGRHGASFARVTAADVLSAPTATFEAMETEIGGLLGLVDAQRRYAESIVASIPSGLVVLREDLAVLRANRSFCEMFSAQRAELVGRSLGDILAAQGLVEAAREVLATGQDRHGLLVEHRPGSGEGRPLRVAITGIRLAEEEEEEEARLLLVVEDLSAEQRLQAEAQVAQERLTHLVSRGPTVIYASRASGDYGATYISPNVVAQLGYESSEFVERPSFWAEQIHPEDRERVFAELPALFEHGHHAHEYRFRHKDGSYRWMRDETRLVRDAAGDPVEVEGSWTDISERKQAKEELRQSEDRLKALVASMNDLVFVLDGDLVFQEYHQPSSSALYVSPEQFVGKRFDAVGFPEPVCGIIEKALRQTLQTGAPAEAEYWMDFAGEKSWFDMHVTSLHGTGSMQTGLTCVVRDITERKEAEEALRRSVLLKSVTSCLGEVFLTSTDEGAYDEVLKVVLGAMDSEYGVFGHIDDTGALVVPSMTRHIWDRCQVPDRRIVFPRDTWGDSSWPRAILNKKAIFSNEPSTGTPPGHVPITQHISQPIIHQGEVIGLLQVANREADYDPESLERMEAIATYVAPVLFARLEQQRLDEERKKAEEAKGALVEQLRIANETMERQVIERTADLRVANEELESFAYSVSHDLRAPLRGMGGFSKVLLEEHAEGLDIKGRHYLERIRTGALTMEQLIDGILQISRLSRSELMREDIDLADLARELAASLQEDEPGRQVDFVIPNRLPANGDPRLLGSVMQNLLGNAWKFTAKEPAARIELGLTGQQEYFVRDNGAGFDEQYADKLFGVFQRLHSSAEFGGLGIGLATVRRIVRRHGGEIRAEGLVGGGATFTFTLEPVGSSTKGT